MGVPGGARLRAAPWSSRSISYSTPNEFCDRFVLLTDGHVLGVGTLGDLRMRTHLPTGSLEEIFLALT